MMVLKYHVQKLMHVAIGNDWNLDNLQVLCRACHEVKTLNDNRLFLSHRRSDHIRCITDWIE